MLECGVMADCSNDRDTVVHYGKMTVYLSIASIHENPTLWESLLQIIVGARFVHDMMGLPLAKVDILRFPAKHFNNITIVNFGMNVRGLKRLSQCYCNVN